MKILFATDGSKDSLNAQAFIGSLPLSAPTEILVTSVVPLPQLVAPGVGREGELRATAAAPEHVQAAEDMAAKSSHTLARAGVATEVIVRAGNPADLICRIAEERKVDLIVIGSHGRSALGRFFLGSVSTQVLKHAAVPVLVARAPARPIQRVLVGVDGSENSRRALSYLAQFPLPRDAKVTLLSVVYLPPPLYGAAGYYETEELNRALETVRRASEVDAERTLQDAARILDGSFSVEKRVVAGLPARTLIETASASGADLVVVGSQGLSAVERWMMGSVSLQVSLHAQASVLVVR